MIERAPLTRMLVPATQNRRFASLLASTVVVAVALAGCSSVPVSKTGTTASIDPKLGVKASPRVVAMGEPVPVGGGRKMVGKPYKVAGKRYVPKLDPDYSKVGLASWYGNAFHGRKTANGEVFNSEALTAAHPTMPLPSYARVTALDTGRSILVRVNDRGPFHSNRLIDISRRTADVLGVRASGVARVKVDYVGPAPTHGEDETYLMASYRGPGDVRPGLAETMIASAEQLPGLAARGASSVAGSAVSLVTGGAEVAVAAVTPGPTGPAVSGSVLPPARPLIGETDYVTVAMVDPAEIWMTASPVQLAAATLPDVTPTGYTEASFVMGAQPVLDGALAVPPPSPLRRSYAADRVNQAYAAVDSMGAGVSLSDLAGRLEARAQAKPDGGPVLQAGVFADRANADRLAARLSVLGSVSVDTVDVGGRVLSRVRVSALTLDSVEAVAFAEKAGAHGAKLLAR